MDIDNMTVKEIKHIQSLLRGGEKSSEQGPYHIGKNYFIRTVTNFYTGNLVRVTAKELVLKDAAWVADAGRFMQAIRDGKLNEVEPFPEKEEVVIGRGAVIDACEWKYDLPREQK